MIPLVRYQDVLWALTVRVGGGDALFLLDTAAGLTTLDRAVTDRLGIRTRGTFCGRRMTGEKVAVDLAHDLDLVLGDRTIRHETVGVLDLSGLLPPDWPPVGGAIGLPTFRALPFRIDLPRRRLVLDAEPGPGAHELCARAARDGPAVDLFVEVRAPARSLWMEVDTANTGPVILSPDAVQALGCDAASDDAVLDVCGLGPVRTPVVVKPIRHDGNLGAPFFASRPLTIDLAAERAWVESGADRGGDQDPAWAV